MRNFGYGFSHSHSFLADAPDVYAMKGDDLILRRVSRCGLVVRRLAGKQKDLGSIRFGSPFSSLQKLSFMDTVL